MSTMSEQLEWIEESESTYVAQSGKRRYVISMHLPQNRGGMHYEE